MRVWDTHPGYLDDKRLLGQHAEIHAIASVICQQRRGYAHHPEVKRWKGRISALALMHEFTRAEMELRGMNHRSILDNIGFGQHAAPLDPICRQLQLLHGKQRGRSGGRIPLPEHLSELWHHYELSVLARGQKLHSKLACIVKEHSDDVIKDELAQKITRVLMLPVTSDAGGLILNRLHERYPRIVTGATSLREILERALCHKSDLITTTILADPLVVIWEDRRSNEQ